MRHIVALALASVALASFAMPAAAVTRQRARHPLYYIEYYPPGTLVHRHRPARYAAVPPRNGPVLTIQKRSFLDAGVVVPVGSQDAYVAQTEIDAPYVVRDLLHQRYDAWRADKLSIPGRPEPLVEFATPGVP
jgi:hypothetical protein